jgi:hypothetical protein
MPLPLEILEELRERFRKENPHLDLPPARSWTQEKETKRVKSHESIRKTNAQVRVGKRIRVGQTEGAT